MTWASDESAEAARAEFEERKRMNGHDQAGAPRFKPIRFRDIALPASSAFVVAGLIPTEGLVVVWGPPKCGKSFFVYDLSMHVTLGQNYRGRRVKQGVVVYVALEGERGLKARTEAYRRTLPEGADPPFYLITTRLDLVADIAEMVRDIRAELGDDTPMMIVIDTLNRSIAGSENDPKDMTAYIRAADELREAFRCAVVLIHHCGVDGTRPRGFTGLSAAADAQIATKRDVTKNIIVHVEFMKDGDEGDEIVSRLRVVDVGDDENGEPITSCIVEPGDPNDLPRKSARPLPPAQGLALQLLAEAINTAGEVPPGSNHIPANVRCVNEELWRQYCYSGSISAGDQGAKQKAFKRAAEALIAGAQVGKWDTWVWPAQAGQTRTFAGHVRTCPPV